MVAAGASLNGGADVHSTSPSAAKASLSSDVPIATPSLRRASAKPIIWALSGKPDAHALGHGVEIGAVLDDDRQRVAEGLLVDVLRAEQQQRARPVDRLRDRRRLLEIQLAHHRAALDEAPGHGLGEAGGVQVHDLELALRRRVVEPQVQAAAL